ECLAAQALLSLVGARAELVGLDDLFDVLAWQVGLEGLNQPAQPVVASNRRTGKFGENCRSVVHDRSYPVAGAREPVAATGKRETNCPSNSKVFRPVRSGLQSPMEMPRIGMLSSAVSGASNSCVAGCSTSSRIDGVICPAAISRNAITVGLSFSGSTSVSAPCAMRRARFDATSTISKMLSTLSRQSSTVILAIKKVLQKSVAFRSS